MFAEGEREEGGRKRRVEEMGEEGERKGGEKD